jgi:Uma2 family endonuclease
MIKSQLHIPRTAVDVFKLLPQGVHCQVIDNTIYMSPSPIFEHQNIILKIAAQIHTLVTENSLGVCIVSPIDVYLNADNVFQPDIVYLSKKNISLIKKDGKIHGTPDMVIEVLSPGNENDDKIKKRKVYELCGVKEYFIVDPKSKEVISCYGKNKKFTEGKKVKSLVASKLLKTTFSF